ncbi:MAG: M20/M25/M40 family metallo-hydrolase [bacterium]|nr:M20/M25/M40 family metallo-hydrolase [bacterium]
MLPETPDVDLLVASLLKDTPMVEDLRELCDEIGGRPTGSKANLESVEWGLKKFKEAGVVARKEKFTLPRFWLERSCEATISGDISFPVRVVALVYSIATPKSGLTARLIDVGHGSEKDFVRAGAEARGAFALVETKELVDIDGLWQEYTDAAAIEKRAFAAGVKGVVYMSSRPTGLLYRHNATLGDLNKHPMMVMEREHALRAARLLRKGKSLSLTAKIDVRDGGECESFNVVGEIKGSTKPGEFVVIGAHLDSWALGTGANDNGCNVVMLIDIARQMKRLGIIPKRTIRFVLWNGEEHGLYGSWKYCLAHADEMDRHVMSCSVDIGSGRIRGFFTNGREDIMEPLNRALVPVKGLGPFENSNEPIVGTDNYDFMMEGVANLVSDHAPANYAPHYHAESDTFDKVDLRQLKLNTAVIAAVTLGFANMEVDWKRQSRDEIQHIIDTTSLKEQMETFFGFYDAWVEGKRGRKK